MEEGYYYAQNTVYAAVSVIYKESEVEVNAHTYYISMHGM